MRKCTVCYQQTTAANVNIKTMQIYHMNIDLILHNTVCWRAMVLGGSWLSAMVTMGPVQLFVALWHAVFLCATPKFGEVPHYSVKKRIL